MPREKDTGKPSERTSDQKAITMHPEPPANAKISGMSGHKTGGSIAKVRERPAHRHGDVAHAAP